MIAAVATGLGSLDVPIPATAGMVGTSWRFLHPVRPGDSLHSVWRLNRKRPVENPRVGLCFWQIDVLNQHGTVVAAGEVGRLVHRRQPLELERNGAEPAEPAGATRSRRRRRRSAPAERVAEVVEAAPVPEPAPADAPPPSRRRRRRRGNGHGNGGGASADADQPEAEPAPPAGPPPASSTGAAARPAAGEGRGLRGVLRRLRGT